MALNIIRRLDKLSREEEISAILMELHPRVAAVIIGSGGEKLEELEKELGIDLYLTGNKELHIEEFNIMEKGSKEKLKKLALPVGTGEEFEIRIEEEHVNNPETGIARIKGYIIIIKGAGDYVGEKVKVKIDKVYRTFACGKVLP
jgi:ribonuclease G